MHEAMLYEKLEDDRVQCHLCAHECRIAGGKRGICRVRENQDGVLYTRVYGQVIARHVDPIEKKPLYHFHPGSTAYSVATPGCNFACRWCQNADISQLPRQSEAILGDEVAPEKIVAGAQKAGCRSIAYTYTEPTIFFEYARDVAQLAKDVGLDNVFVTNGYMTGEMLESFHPILDAANVDLKAFRDETYREFVGARLQPVLDSLKSMHRLGIWLEVTTLIIPGINDDDAELRDAAQFVARELGPETPWHLSRFFPAYRLTEVGPTPLATLQRASEIGREEGVHHIYAGNVRGETNTTCHQCGRPLIRRSGYVILENGVGPEGGCPECGTPLAGVGMEG